VLFPLPFLVAYFWRHCDQRFRLPALVSICARCCLKLSLICNTSRRCLWRAPTRSTTRPKIAWRRAYPCRTPSSSTLSFASPPSPRASCAPRPIARRVPQVAP
jgi:hypothetical protein